MAATVEVSGVCKRFGEVQALDDVSFSLPERRIVGVLGPNGAGKTTLFDILEGLERPDAGHVRLFGAAVEPYPRRRVGVMMQQESRLDRVTAREYADLFAAIQGVPERAGRVLSSAGLEARARVPLARLSGGESARLFLAAAVVHEPDLVFLDEPTAHLDPDHKLRVQRDLVAMRGERTVVVSTHDLREADTVCDFLVFLFEGRVRAVGPKEELVAAVPEAARTGHAVEDAFFHFCAVHIRDGEAAT